MLLDMKPSVIIFIICASVIAVVVILCCCCIIRGRKKKASTRPTTSGSLSSRPQPWPRQATYYDVEFGPGIRTYRQDTQRSEQSVQSNKQDAQEHSIRTETSGSSTRRISEASVRRDRQDDQQGGLKDGGMAILAGAGTAMATAAAFRGLSRNGGDEYGGYGDDFCGDGGHGDGYDDSYGDRGGGGRGGACGASCEDGSGGTYGGGSGNYSQL